MVCLPGSDTPVASHGEVLDAVRGRQDDIQLLVRDIVSQIGSGNTGSAADLKAYRAITKPKPTVELSSLLAKVTSNEKDIKQLKAALKAERKASAKLEREVVKHQGRLLKLVSIAALVSIGYNVYRKISA